MITAPIEWWWSICCTRWTSLNSGFCHSFRLFLNSSEIAEENQIDLSDRAHPAVVVKNGRREMSLRDTHKVLSYGSIFLPMTHGCETPVLPDSDEVILRSRFHSIKEMDSNTSWLAALHKIQSNGIVKVVLKLVLVTRYRFLFLTRDLWIETWSRS